MYTLKKYGIYILVIISICLISVIGYFYNKEDDQNELISIVETTTTISNQVSNTFYVDIKGAIKKPGVYQVNDSMIVNDVIKMAGGLKENAYVKNINLSKKLVSEMVIYIYSKSEVKTTNSTTSIILNDAIYKTTSVTTTKEESTSSDIVEESKLVNINTASKEELMTITGIGASKADSIIAYRESTPFIKIEDIKNVSGIGVNLYETIKDFITV